MAWSTTALFPMLNNLRLDRQIGFIVEIDRLKQVSRRAWLMDGSRRENDAEHSWHLGVMAMLLVEHADPPGVDLSRVLQMLLIHDLVEIDAGDTFAFDEEAAVDKLEREQKAADRIFGLLPPEQEASFRALWEEFERRATPEARFAVAIDRLQPLLHNYFTRGKAWRENGVTSDKVRARVPSMLEASESLGRLAQRLIEESVARGYLPP